MGSSGAATALGIDVTKPAATDDIINANVTGDAGDRFVVDADGTIRWGSGGGALDASLSRRTGSLMGFDFLHVGPGTAWLTNSMLGALASSATYVPIVARGAASQTADLQQWQNSAGTVAARMSEGGALALGGGGVAGRLSVYAGTSAVLGAVIRGAASQTADLTQWQDSAGTVVTEIDNRGRLSLKPDGQGVDTGTIDASLVVNARTASALGLAVRGLASQSADLTQWQNSAGTVVAAVGAEGNVRTTNVVATNNAGSYLSLNGSDALVNQRIASAAALVVRGAPSQTANLLELQNSAGTVLLSVTAAGNLYGPNRSITGFSDIASTRHNNGDSSRWLQWGAGSPEGVVTANVGSLWVRTDGGASTTLYVKESGTGNTGWVAK